MHAASKLTRSLLAGAALQAAALGCIRDGSFGGRLSATSPPAGELRIVAPDLAAPLSERIPDLTYPHDPVRVAVFERINRDRIDGGLTPVLWDEGAARVADAFCVRQVRERSRGHYLTDGVPPYARTGLAGVFGLQSENSFSWITSALEIREKLEDLALIGHEQMVSEKPPHDGHRRTILDPDATHVGVGYAAADGRFQMAQEFLTRHLERLSLSRAAHLRHVVRLEGRTVERRRLQFVTVSVEPPPRPLTRAEASSRSSYSYPRPSFAYVPEGRRAIEVAGVGTQPAIRMRGDRGFSFTLLPDSPGLWTVLFHTSWADGSATTPGGLAVVRVERAPPADAATR
ncbi:MAG: CAP domain-containing protein [Thermoanaerobaculia bacterium]